MEPSATAKHRIGLSSPMGPITVVLRRYHERERLENDFAYDPANEVAALELLGPTAVPAPDLIAYDLDARIVDVPAIVETWVGGSQAWRPGDLDAYLREAAETLVAIHSVPLSDPSPVMTYRPYREGILPVSPDTRHPGLWERVAAILEEPWPGGPRGFIHRDYHPGNALWDGTSVTGVVDWPTAAIGPPGIDLARMRQNLAGWHGKQAADRFTDLYVRAGGDPGARHPFWDLLDAAELGEEDDPEPELYAPGDGDARLFEDYVAAVASELG